MDTTIFPLSGDPVHYGHMQIIERAAAVCQTVYVALGINPDKEGKYLFAEEERIRLANNAIECLGLENRVKVETFSGWLSDYCKEKKVNLLVRGARNADDMKYETAAAEYHRRHGIETILVPTYGEISGLSSTMLKQDVKNGKLVHGRTTAMIKQALEEKLLGVSIIGVTGLMGSGKSTFCSELCSYASSQGALMTHIDCDAVAHSLYSSGTHPDLQSKIAAEFGAEVCEGSSINRKALAKKALVSNESRMRLMGLLAEPFKEEVEKIIAKSKGVVLLDAAYLDKMLPWVNYNVIMVKCDEDERLRRVLARDKMSKEKFRAVSSYLLAPDEFKEKWQEESSKAGNGKLYEADSVKKDYEGALEWIQKNFPMF